MSETCFTCEFSSSLIDLTDHLTAGVYSSLGPGAAELLKSALIAYFLFVGLRLIAGQAGLDDARKIFPVAFLTVVSAALLGDYALIRDWILDPVARTFAATSSVTFEAAGLSSFAPNEHWLLAIMARIEGLFWDVLNFAGAMISLRSPLASVGMFFLAMPWVFWLALTLGFLLEVLLKFAVIGAFSPLFLVALPFRPTRPFTIAAGRILLQAGLSLVFVSFVAAFMFQPVSHYADLIQDTKTVERHAARVERVCEENLDGTECRIAKGAYEAVKKGSPGDPVEFTIFSKHFWLMLLIGTVGSLFTFGAKAMASNISGAMEGGGAAAGIAAGAMGLVGAAVAAPKLVGRVGLGAVTGGPLGVAGAAAVGGAGAISDGAKQIVDRFMGGTSAGGGESASPPSSGLGGGSPTGGMPPDLTKQLKQLNQGIGQLNTSLGKILREK